MQEQNGLTPEEQELEQALQSLTPKSGELSPITAAFAAGRRSAKRQIAAWRFGASLMLLLAACSWLPRRSSSAPQGNLIPAHFTPESTPTFSAQSVAMLQKDILNGGVDSLPPSTIPIQTPVYANGTF